jgi:hypothetical protein
VTIEEEIERLERSLLESAVRRSSARLDALLADEFVEFGSSGRAYDKAAILAALPNETLVPMTMHDFRARVLNAEIVHATYQTFRLDESGVPKSRSLRSSLWQYIDMRWRLVFHQGTLAPLEQSI